MTTRRSCVPFAALAATTAALAGCPSPNLYTTPRALPQGQIQHTVAMEVEPFDSMISLVTRWAKEIKQRDQSNLQPQELLAQSLREILGKKVTLDAIEKLPPPPKAEKKDLEFTFPTISLKENPADEKDDADEPAEKK